MSETIHELWRRLEPLDETQIATLERYLDLLIDTNQRMNLTRIVDRDQARLQHIADSLTLLLHIPVEAKRLADVGSGGGVPGIPLAIARPDLEVTLIESIQKKGRFLSSAIEALGLSNVSVKNDRAERVGDRFDVVTCRAVASLDKLVEWCAPLLVPGGVLLAMKGPKLAEEMEAAGPVLRRARASVDVDRVKTSGLEGHVVASVRFARK